MTWWGAGQRASRWMIGSLVSQGAGCRDPMGVGGWLYRERLEEVVLIVVKQPVRGPMPVRIAVSEQAMGGRVRAHVLAKSVWWREGSLARLGRR